MSKPRGMAAMSPETQRRVAQAGGLATSQKPGHMAEIGKQGGLKISQNVEHMKAIGSKGGKAPRKK